MMNPFKSFWMAGFECSDQMNAFGNRVDLLAATGHLQHIREDYERLNSLQIRTVREGIRWSKVEYQPYKYDWSAVLLQIRAAEEQGIQVLWDLCHFGYPDDLSPLYPMFARRFTHLCKAFVHFYRSVLPDEPLIITPVNEVSFISWLGGDVKGTTPYCRDYGWEVKYGLMKAYIEGIQMIRSMDDKVIILSTEPLVNIVPCGDDEVFSQACVAKNEQQFQVLDMLTGRICPELGGRDDYLDIIGLNYYHNNQWTFPEESFICWKEKDKNKGWRSLYYLCNEVYQRYDRPFIIAETSHCEEERVDWINYMAAECCEIINKRLPMYGVCLYPIIDRPDWDHTDKWHHSGVWDIYDTETLERVLHQPTFDAIKKMQHSISRIRQIKSMEVAVTR